MHDEHNPPRRGPSAKVVPLRPRDAATPTSQSAKATRMSRLRTLFVIDELDIGGTEQQILETVRRIDRDRFEPYVCCFRHGAKAREIESLGVPVLHEPKRLKADPGLVLRLAAMMKRERFDIVQTYLWTANTWARIAARMAGVRWVLASERNVDIWEETYKRVVGRFLARSTDRIIANSEAVRQYLLKRGGLAPDKVVTIYNGVNFDRFRKPCDPMVRRRELGIADDVVLAGCLARVEPAKDHATLLQAIALISNRVPKLHLVLIGGGSEEERLKRMAHELGIAPRVHFVGFRTDAAEWLQSVDLSVLSSVKEGLSNTVLESMAAGKPVVATDVGGNAEVIVEGQTGHLVPSRSPNELGDAIAHVASSAETMAAYGAAGRRRVDELFAVDAMVKHTERLYLELVGSGARAAA
jgi:glycosyltransferase involved in cell wall biosynthesis